MRPFDSFAVVDWSAANDTGPRPKKDAIWAGLVRDGTPEAPVYLRNREGAEAWISDLIAHEVGQGRRLLIGFDFPFGYPAGFARALTGKDDPFAVWAEIARRLVDTPSGNNRFDLAASFNARLGGRGPFWFNGLARDIPHLPRKKHARSDASGLPERRAVERVAKGSFTCWQMGGAGAVGGQVMTGIACLERLRHRFRDELSIWPFEDDTRPVRVVEIWPSLINASVKAAGDDIRDRAQVRLLSRALSRLPGPCLERMLDVDAPEEGWILGLGFEDELNAAAMPDLTPPRLKNDCFALPPGVDWTPVDEALARLRDRLTCVVGEIREAPTAGRVLAEDVRARRANPPAANSAVDGFGFAHAATGSGDQLLPLADGRAAAGTPFEGRVEHGHALRILTGALLPAGVDTVVLEEDVTQNDTHIAFEGPIRKGANARAAGEDVAEGAIILTKGTRLGAPECALLAATGVTEVAHYERLRVGVLSTGDELTVPGTTADPARTYDANRPMLLTLIENMGFDAIDLGHAKDMRRDIEARLNDGAATTDAILTSGGASAGDEDHVSALLKEKGALADWRIALKPGRPLALAVWNGVPVFGLPGNPVAALVCTLIFARPALGKLAGQGWHAPQGFTVPAAFTKNKKPGRREYLRARMNGDGAVDVFASEGSGRISGLAWADGLVELSDGAQTITPGTPVRYLPYTSFR